MAAQLSALPPAQEWVDLFSQPDDRCPVPPMDAPPGLVPSIRHVPSAFSQSPWGQSYMQAYSAYHPPVHPGYDRRWAAPLSGFMESASNVGRPEAHGLQRAASDVVHVILLRERVTANRHTLADVE